MSDSEPVLTDRLVFWSSSRPLCKKCNIPLSGEILHKDPVNTRHGLFGKIFPKMKDGGLYTYCINCGKKWKFDWNTGISE